MSGKPKASAAERKAWSLLKYIVEHPSERFWQAVRNWSGHGFIFFGDQDDNVEDAVLHDSFNDKD